MTGNGCGDNTAVLRELADRMVGMARLSKTEYGQLVDDIGELDERVVRWSTIAGVPAQLAALLRLMDCVSDNAEAVAYLFDESELNVRKVNQLVHETMAKGHLGDAIAVYVTLFEPLLSTHSFDEAHDPRLVELVACAQRLADVAT